MGDTLSSNVNAISNSNIIETYDGIFIKNNYYRKDNLSGIAKVFCNFGVNTGTNILCTSRNMYLSGTMVNDQRHHDFGIVPDPYIPNRYYFAINNQYSNASNTFSYLIFAEETGEDDITIIKSVSQEKIIWTKIYDIDIKNIYIAGINIDNGYEYIYKINKSNYTVTNINSNGGCRTTHAQLIYKTDSKLYFIINQTRATFWLFIYNKDSETVILNKTFNPPNITVLVKAISERHNHSWPTTNWQTTDTSNNKGIFAPDNSVSTYDKRRDGDNAAINAALPSDAKMGAYWLANAIANNEDIIKYRNNIYMLFLAFNNNNNNKFNITYNYGYSWSTVTYQLQDVNNNLALNNFAILKFDTDLEDNDNKKCEFIRTDQIGIQEKSIKWIDNTKNQFRFFIKDNYIYFCLYDESNSVDAMLECQGIHILKILDNDFNLEYVTKIQITNQKHIISMLYSKDKEILLIGYYESFEIYLYNKENHLYEPTGTIMRDIISCGIDTQDKIYYQKKDNSVYCDNLSDPKDVEVKFEHKYYTYRDKDIKTYLTFSAKGMIGIPIGEYTLTLSDNAYFDSSNSHELTINYTGDDTIQYNVTITGPRRVVCDVVYHKEWS